MNMHLMWCPSDLRRLRLGEQLAKPSGSRAEAIVRDLEFCWADLAITLIWPFDHNGIFHLIQMLGPLLMTLAVRRSLAEPMGGDAAARPA